MRAAVPRARLEARISPAARFQAPAFDVRAEFMDMEDYDVIVVGVGSPGVPRAPDAGCAQPVLTQEVMP